MRLTPWEPDLRTIVERIDGGDIDLQPDFQRQEIWLPIKKKRLIDSILRGWSIPPVFLVVTTDNRMHVLDGQQRLAAVRDFMHNEFTIDGAITPPEEKIEALDGYSYRRLPPDTKRLFDQYSLRCFRITDYSPEEPSELFYRLNQPSILTAGEQRNAFYGPAREQLKALVDQFERGGNDKSTIGFSNARLAYDDIIARLLFFLEAKTFSIRGSETGISQRFRTREEFAKSIIARAKHSIDHFTASREEVFSARLNKASVLSWLIFFSRFEKQEPSLGFMRKFVTESKALSKNHMREAIEVFQDRASLRVTNVTSVVYRDLCLWYVYVFSQQRPIPDSVSIRTLDQLKDILDEKDEYTFEAVLNETLDVDAWSKLR